MTKRRPSLFGTDKKHCLCFVLRPLIILLQLIGVLPVTRHSESCSLTYSWKSFSALINFGWIIASWLVSIWLFTNSSAVLSSVTSGTDFYTFLANSVTSLVSCCVIYVMGGRGANMVCKGWEHLHRTIDELALPNFKTVKRTVYLLPILIIEEFLIDMSLLLYTYYFKDRAIDIEFGPVITGLSVFLLNFIPNIMCGSYAILLWIVAINFNAINVQVNNLLIESSANLTFVSTIIDKSNGSYHNKSSGRRIGQLKAQNSFVKSVQVMSRLRILHEDLCKGVRYLEKAFGFQMLVIFFSTGFSVVAGIYGFIIASAGLMDSDKLRSMSMAFSIQSVLSGSRLLFVLITSQYLINKANGTGHILNSFDLTIYSEDMQFEVEKFLRKLGEFPLKITCCDVFPLTTSVLAAATGNVVTYVLVLMQFKLNSKSAQSQAMSTG